MDKTREISILNMVYSVEDKDEIIEGEKPDFRIRNKNQKTFFGIEITEFYYSESDARLQNLPNYFVEILDTKKYRHKDDKVVLKVDSLTVQSDDKPDIVTDGILREYPSLIQHSQMVAKTINSKDQKLKLYDSGLSHINLIILDNTARFRLMPHSQFYTNFFTKDLKTVLFNSTFREVFYLTQFKTGTWFHVPLMMLLMLSDLYLFDGVLHERYPQKKPKSAYEELLLFASHFMRNTNAKEMYIAEQQKEIELIYGNWGILLTDDKRVTVRDYADYPPPKYARPINISEVDKSIDDDFEKNYSEFAGNNTFTGEIGFICNRQNLV